MPSQALKSTPEKETFFQRQGLGVVSHFSSRASGAGKDSVRQSFTFPLTVKSFQGSVETELIKS